MGGLTALAVQKRGRKTGTQRRLTPRQEVAIQKAITDTTVLPRAQSRRVSHRRSQAECGETRPGTLSHQRYGIRMPVRMIGHYLRRWGFAPRKPLKRVYEQRSAEIQCWLDHDYPTIAARAKREGAEIHWGEEASLSTSDPRGRGFASRGHTPVLEVVSRRKYVTFLPTVTNQRPVRFMVLDGPLSAPMLIRVLRRLIRSTAHATRRGKRRAITPVHAPAPPRPSAPCLSPSAHQPRRVISFDGRSNRCGRIRTRAPGASRTFRAHSMHLPQSPGSAQPPIPGILSRTLGDSHSSPVMR